MTTAIYSDKKATVSLGNIFGYSGPVDWALQFDFVRESYQGVIDGVRRDVDFRSYLSVAREGSAAFFNEANLVQTVPANVLRVGKTARSGAKGLISEDERRNVFKNPMAPATHTANFVFMPASPVIVLSCEGSAGSSVSLSGDISTTHNGTTTGATVTAFAGQGPVVAFPTAGRSDWSLNYIVNGTLTSVSAASQPYSAGLNSPFVTNLALGAVYPQDAISFNPGQIASLSSPGTILLAGEAGYAAVLAATHSRIFGSVVSADKKAYAAAAVRKTTTASVAVSRVRQDGVNTELLTNSSSDDAKFSVAIRWAGNEGAVAVYGKAISNANGEGIAPSTICIGSDFVGSWSGVSPTTNGLRGTIGLMRFYNRVLTDEEIIAASASMK